MPAQRSGSRDRRSLMDADTSVPCGVGQAPGQPRRVDQAAPLGQIGGPVVGRGVHLGPRLVGGQCLRGPPVGAGRLHDLRYVRGLVGRRGKGELTVFLEPGIYAVRRHRLLDRREVLAPEALQLRHLLGPARRAVLDPVGERRVHEPPVAPARPERDPLALQQHDLVPGFARQQGGPQSVEPAPDHDQIGLVARLERRARLGRVRLREPERARLGVGEGPPCLSGGDGHRARSSRSPR